MAARAEQWLFVINRFSGGGRAASVWPQLESALALTPLVYHAVFTCDNGHAVVLTENLLLQGYRRFVVLGGDGTVNEVVNGLYRQPQLLKYCCLTAFPCGTGNDWAALHGLPGNLNAFVAMLQKPHFFWQDIGCATYQLQGQERCHYFVNFIGSGFDSYLLQQMGAAQGKRLKYFYYVLKCLRQYSAPVFTLVLDGQTVSARALMVMACIGKYGGAGMIFAPDAEPGDHNFDLLHIADMPLLRRLTSLASLFNGRIARNRHVRNWRVPSLQLQADECATFQCDGEIVGQLPVTVNNAQMQLCIVVRSGQ